MAATATGHRLPRLRNFLPHFPLRGPECGPPGWRRVAARVLSASRGSRELLGARRRLALAVLRGNGEPRYSRSVGAAPQSPAPAAKFPAAGARRPAGAPTHRDMPARLPAPRSAL